jgi:molybdopterin-guanine dinucleotide biosynthesis protein A
LWISARARPDWCPEDIEVILDEPPSRGPLSGIAAALARLRTSHLLALAIDMPQMTTAHIRKLWSCTEAGRGVVPINENWFEPLCAIYPAGASDVARRALSQGQLSLQDLARNLNDGNWIKRYEIQDGEKHFYFNFNEQEN